MCNCTCKEQFWDKAEECRQFQEELDTSEMLRKAQEKVAVDSRKLACELYKVLKAYAPHHVTDKYLNFDPWLEK